MFIHAFSIYNDHVLCILLHFPGVLHCRPRCGVIQGCSLTAHVCTCHVWCSVMAL